MLSGVAYAAYNILTKIAMQRGYRPMSVTLYGFLGMTLVSLCVSNPVQIVQSVIADPAVTLPLCLGLGLCTVVFPYCLYTLAMRDLPAGTASALGIIEPMSATVFSVLLFREELDWLRTSGIALILLAVFLLGKYEGKGTTSNL